MKLDRELLQHEWHPETRYRPIGQALETLGKSCVFTHESDATKPNTLRNKVSFLFRSLASLPGAALRALASLDKSYFTLETPATKPQLSKPDELQVLTLNAACLPSWITTTYNHLRSTEERAQEIADYIATHQDNYDVICLQEVFSESAISIIKDRLATTYGWSVHHAGREYFGFNSGLCIFSKFPIVSADFERYRRLVGEDAMTNKGYLSADIQVGEKKVRVYTTHTQAGGYPKFLKKKWLLGNQAMRHSFQFESFARHIQKAEKSNQFAAVIVTGDFNLKVSDEKEKNAHGKCLFQLFTKHRPQNAKKIPGTTYTKEYLTSHNKEKAAKSEPFQTKGRIIDGCFVTKNSKIKKMTVKIVEEFTNSSDHLAIWAKITLRS